MRPRALPPRAQPPTAAHTCTKRRRLSSSTASSSSLASCRSGRSCSRSSADGWTQAQWGSGLSRRREWGAHRAGAAKGPNNLCRAGPTAAWPCSPTCFQARHAQCQERLQGSLLHRRPQPGAIDFHRRRPAAFPLLLLPLPPPPRALHIGRGLGAAGRRQGAPASHALLAVAVLPCRRGWGRLLFHQGHAAEVAGFVYLRGSGFRVGAPEMLVCESAGQEQDRGRPHEAARYRQPAGAPPSLPHRGHPFTPSPNPCLALLLRAV